MAETSLIATGIHALTGKYLLPPDWLDPLRRQLRRKEITKALRQVPPPWTPIDPCALATTGWGIVLPQDVDPAIREALRPLVALRREQASGESERRFRELEVAPGESRIAFLGRYGVFAGPPVVEQVPYYLLLVGGPAEIPFRFQYELDVGYAVGRIAFATAEGYAGYAERVVAAERGQIVRRREALIFAPEHPNDENTQFTNTGLAAPLVERLDAARPEWKIAEARGTKATKAGLLAAFDGEQSPALVFTVGHGLGFPCGHPRQQREQGALVCDGWKGPQDWLSPVPRTCYLAAEDLEGDTRAAGLVTLHVACYGAGTPERDNFIFDPEGTPPRIAPQPFLGALATALLERGAQAVIGHIERAFLWSFQDLRERPQLAAFEQTLLALLDGVPVGAAFEVFNQRYAQLATALPDGDLDGETLLALWAARNDARNYVVLGDPAVRLRAVASSPEAR